MQYRIYLLDARSRICAAESFSAPTDAEAKAMAAAIHEACSDVFAGYEVWCGTECVVSTRKEPGARTGPAVDHAAEAQQSRVLDLEDRLQRAFLCVGRSRKLLDATTRLRRLERS